MKFTDKKLDTETPMFKRSNVILSITGHVIVIVLGLVTFSGSAVQPPIGGDSVINVDMITLAPPQPMQESEQVVESTPEPVEEVAPEVQEPVEPPAAAEEQVEEVIEEPPAEVIPEEPQVEPVQEPVEHPEEDPVTPESETQVEPSENYATIEATGSAGGGVPGPGSYESRVFNAIRRGFRTSLKPEQTYLVIVTVSAEGVLSYETVRDSNVAGFDRAVENALAIAGIPPNNLRRVYTIPIEFKGVE